MGDSKDLQDAHNAGQKDESENRIDPLDALVRAFVYSQDEKDAYQQGRESVRKQRDDD